MKLTALTSLGLNLLGRMVAFACSKACLLLLAQSPDVEFVQAQCCSNDAGQLLALLFHDICPQTLTVIKIPDMVATSTSLHTSSTKFFASAFSNSAATVCICIFCNNHGFSSHCIAIAPPGRLLGEYSIK